MGESVNFIGYLVINTVQLGATIDYGILLTTHYLRHRRRVPARKPRTLRWAKRSRRCSCRPASWLLRASRWDSRPACRGVQPGLLLARGALLSLTLVTCFLPALLVLLDRVIRRTTWHANFAPVAAAEPAVPAASEVVDAASPVAPRDPNPPPLPASEGDES